MLQAKNVRAFLAVLSLALAAILSACADEAGPEAPTPIQPTAQPTTVAPIASPQGTPDAQPADVSKLFDVGGHKLFIECSGEGKPVVILEAGLGVSSDTWWRVQPEVAKFTRVCRYDRAGLARSEPGPLPRTSKKIVAELHALLQKAGMDGPYVMVGASFGGMNVQMYASDYPQEVVGLVLVDSTHPDLDERIEKIMTAEEAAQRRQDLAANAEGITFADIEESDAQMREIGKLPQVPLIALRHGIPFGETSDAPIEKLWVELQNDTVSKIPGGKLIVADKSGHRIHEQQPELVVNAIQEVVAQARQKILPPK